MDLNKLFLSEKEEIKIHLLIYIQENPGSGLYTFLEYYDIPYPKLLHLYHQLVDELKVWQNKKFDDVAELISSIDVDDYRHYVFTTREAYQVVLAILQESDGSFEAFLQRTGISRTKVYRSTGLLRKVLENYGLKLKINDFIIEGNEILIQYFFFNFLVATRTPLEGFLPAKFVRGACTLSHNFVTPVAHRDSLVVVQREILMGISILRMSQGYRYPLMSAWADLPLAVNAHTSRTFIEYLQVSYDMDGVEAKQQADAISFMFMYEVGFINELDDGMKAKLFNLFNRANGWRELWEEQGFRMSPARQEEMQLHLMSYFINVFNLGEMPTSRKTYIEQIPDETVSLNEVAYFRRKLRGIFVDIGQTGVGIRQLDMLGSLIRRFNQTFTTVLATPTAYLLDDRRDIQGDVIEALLNSVVDFQPLLTNDVEAIDPDCILIYATKTPLVEEIVTKREDVTLFKWVQQMTLRQNYERFLTMMSKYQRRQLQL